MHWLHHAFTAASRLFIGQAKFILKATVAPPADQLVIYIVGYWCMWLHLVNICNMIHYLKTETALIFIL